MKYLEDDAIPKLTSFGCGGKPEKVVIAESVDDIQSIVDDKTHPLWILGTGANTLISDNGLPGLTVLLRTGGIEIHESTANAEAGVVWDDLVLETINSGLWGLECMSGIPGTVGAAVVGNIAAYGQAVSDSLVSVKTIDYKSTTPEITEIAASELGLGYRTSSLNSTESSSTIVLSAKFDLSTTETKKLEYESALKVADELGLDINALEGRRSTILTTRERAGAILDPNNPEKTAGSFFKNPLVNLEIAEEIMKHEERQVTKAAIRVQNKLHGGDVARVSAAHVLLAAGFKRGQSWGPVRLHPDHILKIENTGEATSQQIYDVAQEIMSTVKEKLGVDLEPEVRFLGDFGQPDR